MGDLESQHVFGKHKVVLRGLKLNIFDVVRRVLILSLDLEFSSVIARIYPVAWKVRFNALKGFNKSQSNHDWSTLRKVAGKAQVVKYLDT